MTAYYNELDPGAAAWLRELIKAKAIAPGHVDERDIRDVRPSDLQGFTQCHFFAGIGVWSYALRLAGWSDSEPVWTGSCPCQPFSTAGRGLGFADPRHLWPSWFHLIRERNPPNIFGEQVASPDGLRWIDLVQTHMEAENYAFGAADTCAAGIGAPHIRQRLYFVAESCRERLERIGLCIQPRRSLQDSSQVGGGSEIDELVNAGCEGGGRNTGAVFSSEGEGTSQGFRARRFPDEPKFTGPVDELAHGSNERCGESSPVTRGFVAGDRPQRLSAGSVPSGHVNGFWRDAEWIYCRDGKYRPVEPGTSPLAHEPAARVGRLRGYGNAIVAEQAAAFIQAYMQC